MANKLKATNLDEILTELGEFGKFQTIIFALLFIPIIVTPFYLLSYIFTASQLDYRYCTLKKKNEKYLK